MDYYIYMTTNLINGKKYIGQHKGKPDDKYFGSGINILKAIKKYGKENFSKEILCFCETREEADIKEKEYIQKYDAVNNKNFYNIAKGGIAGNGWCACHKYFKAHPDEAKELAKKRAEKLRRWHEENPEEFQERIIKPLLEGAKKWRETHPNEVEEIMKKVNEKKVEWQRTHPEEHRKQVDEWRRKGSEANSQEIYCVTTDEIFPSQCAAARHYGIAQTNISKCIRGERHSAGKHPETGEKLVWKRVE